jgi:hypothetical protein
VTALAGEGDPPTAPFTFFTEMVAQAAGKKTVIDLQARTGTEIQVTQSAEGLRCREHANLNTPSWSDRSS